MNPQSVVFNEDCMLGMARYPDKFFDLAIVDPPYGIGLSMINKVGSFETIHDELKDWNNCIPDPLYFKELYRVSKHRIVWGCNYYAQFISSDMGRIVHDKKMSSEGTKFNFSHADLASCSLFKRIVMFRYQWSGNRQNGTVNWNNDGPDGRIHPTQKPIALYKYCLQHAKVGWKILDTHMGSQSSRIAAYNMGFDYYGWEIDKEYFTAGNKRFVEQTAQQQLFR